jgi:DNA polymerase delta subunit 4
MAPRRSSGRTTGQQSTLSFSNSRVTKPSATAAAKQIKAEPIAKEIIKEATSDASRVVPVVESPEPPVADIVTEKEKDELDEPQTDEDRKALKVTETAIRNYWIEEERGRSTPRGMPVFLHSHT